MSEPLLITSPANARLKAIAGLRRRRAREQERRTLVEGHDELVLALDAGVVPELLLLCPELAPAGAVEELAGRVADGPTQVVHATRAAFEKAAYRESPDGVLAVVGAVGSRPADLSLPPDALVLLCEGVEKPGNLGAMLRTADAAGVDAVVAADPVTDWGNPNTVRASKGTVFSVPVAADGTTVTLDWLDGLGIPLVAATPDTEMAHTEVDYRGPVAIAVGTEKTGLTDEVLRRAAHRVRIPMVGRVNSLNVATSAAIIVYEAVRQRG
ncbi:23S rRNA (guanosine-2'-O-) -methyltransferase rlmB [Serinicoccus hydrothermalis]|uniref:23S rRNA (Guanosine-2'-O-) -methyltransferase rlmB n=1 Tax=Serinicoccus hydrothermalis TaxID=1758689 RepID=A0A1B1NC94_9MICO|nr:TrmH family RNA methyltransferase [Serinicoccus hydrothermalis]ANS79057.1 23S rRNA (guanosine-2'-O-) -methyltransferase rlmB [Serinicoccus hydrothermalis]